MATRFGVTIDCADPERLVRFWSQALHYEVEDPPDGSRSWFTYWRSIGIPESELEGYPDVSTSIVDPDDVGPRIWFQNVPEPKTVKNRVHLDLDVTDHRTVPLAERIRRVDAEVARLVGLGATVARRNGGPGQDYYAITLTDPEGNEFCVS